MSESDSLASVPTPEPERPLAWPAWLRPFRPIVWPGAGPRLDLARDWPELAFIALAVLLFWRGAPASDVPNAVEAAGRALLHPVFGLPAALLGVTGGARFALLAGLLAAASGMWWLGGRPGVGPSRPAVGQPGVHLRRRGRRRLAGGAFRPRSGVCLAPVGAGLCAPCCAVAPASLRRRRGRRPGADPPGGRLGADVRHARRPGTFPGGGGYEPAPRPALHCLSPGRGADCRVDRSAGLRPGRDPASATTRRGL